MDYGRAIRIVRNACGLSQADLASRLTVGASHLSLIEAGKRHPSLNVLVEIATATGVPMHLLSLLASNAADLDRPEKAAEANALAMALLRVLISGGEQPSLPLKTSKETA